jgi:prepilin-type N-terminal cleavage/methylation domain-containing protein
MRTQRGFTLIEIMIVVVIIGLLAAIAIPMFMGHMKKAKAGEAQLQLGAIAKGAKAAYQTNTQFPQGSAGVLPGADGSACSQAAKKFAVTTAWMSDPVWSALDFHIDEQVFFSYHYDSTGLKNAAALAVGDLDCDGTHATYRLDFAAADGTPSAVLTAPLPSAD